MTPRYDAVLFDNDGTLTDSVARNREFLRALVHRYRGSDCADTELDALLGSTLDGCIRALVPDVPLRECKGFMRTLDADITHPYTLFPDTLPALDALRSLGVKLGTLTSRGRRTLRVMYAQTGLAPYFKRGHVVDFHHLKPDFHKPHPQGIHLLCERMRVDVSRVLYVGDTPTDIIAGSRAGVDTGLVSRTAAYTPSGGNATPTHFLPTLLALVPIVRGSNACKETT